MGEKAGGAGRGGCRQLQGEACALSTRGRGGEGREEEKEEEEEEKPSGQVEL